MDGRARVRVGVGVGQDVERVPLEHQVVEQLGNPVAALGWGFVDREQPREGALDPLGLLDALVAAHQAVGAEHLLGVQFGDLGQVDRDPEQVDHAGLRSRLREERDSQVDRGLPIGVDDDAVPGRVDEPILGVVDRQEDVRMTLDPNERTGEVVAVEPDLVPPGVVGVPVAQELLAEEVLVVGPHPETRDRLARCLVGDHPVDAIADGRRGHVPPPAQTAGVRGRSFSELGRGPVAGPHESQPSQLPSAASRESVPRASRRRWREVAPGGRFG